MSTSKYIAAAIALFLAGSNFTCLSEEEKELRPAAAPADNKKPAFEWSPPAGEAKPTPDVPQDELPIAPLEK